MTIFVIYSLGVLYAGAYWNEPILSFHTKIARAVKAARDSFQR